jgi:hypothetical protein
MRAPLQAKTVAKTTSFGVREDTTGRDPGPRLSCTDPSSGVSSESGVACEPATATSRAITLAQLLKNVAGGGSRRTSPHAVLSSAESARVTRNLDDVSVFQESEGGTERNNEADRAPSSVVSEALRAPEPQLPEPQLRGA